MFKYYLLINLNLLKIHLNEDMAVTVDEMRKHFKARRDKELKPIFNVSASTISNWRNKGIPLLWQQAIQLQSKKKLIAREEDVKINTENA